MRLITSIRCSFGMMFCIFLLFLQVHLNHIDAVVQLRPSMSHAFSGRAYTRQALQSREMNGGASGSKASSRKVLHKFTVRFNTICCSEGLLSLKFGLMFFCIVALSSLKCCIHAKYFLSNTYADYVFMYIISE
jgi:hypothetical protein